MLFSCGAGGEAETSDTRSPETAAKSDTSPDTASDSLKSEDIFDENGKTVGKNYYNSEGYLISRETYDFAGRVAEYTTFNPSGDVSTSTKYTYVSDDKIAQYTFEIYEYEKGALKQLVRRLYNADDLLISVTVTDGNGDKVESFNYEYDENGRMTKESRIDAKNILDRIGKGRLLYGI